MISSGVLGSQELAYIQDQYLENFKDLQAL